MEIEVYYKWYNKHFVITRSTYHKDMAIFTSKKDYRHSFCISATDNYLDANFSLGCYHTHRVPKFPIDFVPTMRRTYVRRTPKINPN